MFNDETRRLVTHEWREDEGEAEGPVAKAGGVGDEDVTDQVDGIVADPVERVSSRVSRSAFEGSGDNDAYDVNNEEGEPGLSTSPQVESLCNGQLEDATDDGTEDASGADSRKAILVSKAFLRSK